MAERSKPDRTETFNYSAGSYERLRSNEGKLVHRRVNRTNILTPS